MGCGCAGRGSGDGGGVAVCGRAGAMGCTVCADNAELEWVAIYLLCLLPAWVTGNGEADVRVEPVVGRSRRSDRG